VLCKVVGVRTYAFAADSLTEGKGSFGVVRVTAGVVEVLLVICRFLVNCGSKRALFNEDVDIKKSDVERGYIPSKVHRELGVQLSEKQFKGIGVVWPDHKDVVYESEPTQRLMGCRGEKFFL
jgi:hypothetical protein